MVDPSGIARGDLRRCVPGEPGLTLLEPTTAPSDTSRIPSRRAELGCAVEHDQDFLIGVVRLVRSSLTAGIKPYSAQPRSRASCGSGPGAAYRPRSHSHSLISKMLA
jgi:hypothetical protein